MLEHHLGNSFMEKEEIDKKTVIRTNWKKLIKQVGRKAQAHRSKTCRRVLFFTRACLSIGGACSSYCRCRFKGGARCCQRATYLPV